MRSVLNACGATFAKIRAHETQHIYMYMFSVYTRCVLCFVCRARARARDGHMVIWYVILLRTRIYYNI